MSYFARPVWRLSITTTFCSKIEVRAGGALNMSYFFNGSLCMIRNYCSFYLLFSGHIRKSRELDVVRPLSTHHVGVSPRARDSDKSTCTAGSSTRLVFAPNL
jgi:hypothetical protein